MNIAIVSLGCPKNQVDADRFCRALIDAGHETVPHMEMADAVLINTCGFIDSAKEEAIQYILEACSLKQQNPELKVLVCGCLAERYQADIARELPEVDAVVGLGSVAKLPEILQQLAQKEAGEAPLQAYGPKQALPLDGPRVISTPVHYAYLKIAEGCSNACSYCAIPAIRGPLRSRPVENVLQEARWLAEQGVKELLIVAQDVTAYGADHGEKWLVPLLRQLEKIDGIEWIRLLYTYPERIDNDLLQLVAASHKVLPYFDIPIQHCNDTILRSMRRKGGAQAVQKAICDIRAALPQAILRTSLIAGYPGESEEQFEELCRFVQQVHFDRLGCFAYSPEEGTAAERLPDQLPEEERNRRADIIMQLQGRIMAEKQEALVGKTLRVLCDGYDDEEGVWLCRSAADAPEIDANVIVESENALQPGTFYQVRVTGAEGVDLLADVE